MNTRIFAVIVLALIHWPLVCGAADLQSTFGRPPNEPYLEKVQGLSIPRLKELHDLGHMDATIQLARMLWWEGDAETPIQLLKLPAEQDIPVAQYLLGTYFRFKNRDPSGAVYWLTKAANAGHPIAQESLAGFYESGLHGVPKVPHRAYQLYRAAAEQGLKHSEFTVGLFLCNGIGVEVNKTEGKVWFLRSQEGQRVPLPLSEAGCE
ncbi:MAG: sel1 repeat family protein [Betaproteobacteria bacterium]|nr:sel1 repeat family protein [Betaproteobacteria bacterium]